MGNVMGYEGIFGSFHFPASPPYSSVPSLKVIPVGFIDKPGMRDEYILINYVGEKLCETNIFRG